MYWIPHLTPQPSRYDGRAQLRHGLQPRTWQVDQTRLYQTPPDELDKRNGKRRELARRPSRERAEFLLRLAGGPKNR